MDKIKELQEFAIENYTDVVFFTTSDYHDYLYIRNIGGIGNVIDVATGLCVTSPFIESTHIIRNKLDIAKAVILKKF